MVIDLQNIKVQSLDDLRLSLKKDADSPRDFIKILEDHHNYLEESIRVLMNPKIESGQKRIHLIRFSTLINMHSHAEEQTLYIWLKANEDKMARIEGFGGQDDHDVTYQLLEQLNKLNFKTNWSDEIEAKATRIAGLIKNHIKEEENQMFKVARKDISEEDLQSLAGEYIKRCQWYLDQELNKPSYSINQNSNI